METIEPSLCCKNINKLLLLSRSKGKDEHASLPLSVRYGIMHQETGVVLFHLSWLWIVHLQWQCASKIWAAAWQLGEGTYARNKMQLVFLWKAARNSPEASLDVFHFVISGHNKIFTYVNFSWFICWVLWSGFLSAHMFNSSRLLSVVGWRVISVSLT